VNYQGVGLRFVATLIDSVLLAIPACVMGFVIAGATDSTTSSGFALEGAPALLYFVLIFGLWLGYYTLLEGLIGGTLGKLVLGMRVLREDGGKIGLQEALIRNLLRIPDAFFFYLIGVVSILTSPVKQRIGDRVARTVVVRKSDAVATEPVAVPSNTAG
jgi:uncharacterized RDD family membrane protein YckC